MCVCVSFVSNVDTLFGCIYWLTFGYYPQIDSLMLEKNTSYMVECEIWPCSISGVAQTGNGSNAWNLLFSENKFELSL